MSSEIESIGLAMDTSGVERGIKSLETLAATGPKVEKAVAGVENAATKASKSLATLGQGGAATNISNLGKAGETAAAGVAKVGGAAEKSAREIKNMDRAADGAGTSLAGLNNVAGLAARSLAAIGVGVSVRELVSMADASTNVASRLGLVTSSSTELVAVQQRLFGIAQASRVSFVDLVGTYSQVARSTKDLGVSQNALLGVIQTVSQAVTISGGSAASAQAALVQLSQGFAAGALRGEELNSVMEQTPRLAQAIADGLGISIGQLRALGQAGELTAEKVLGALQKSAAQVSREFDKMAVTVEQASTQAANSALKLVGALDKITGASAATASGITRISAGMDGLTLNIERLASSKGLSNFFFLAFNNERSLNGELEITQKELLKLESQLAKSPSNIYTRSAVAEMREYVKEIKEAQARLASLTGQAAPNPAMNAGVTASGVARERFERTRAADVASLNALRLKVSGVPDNYVKEMSEVIRLNQAGVLVGKEYTQVLKQMQDELLKKTGVTKGADAALSDSLSAQVQAYKNADDLIIKNKQAAVEEIARLAKMGAIGELDAVDRTLEIEEAAWAKRKANFDSEIAQAAKKKNSAAEVARISGQAATAEAEYQRTVAKLTDDATAAQYKQLDVLDAIAKKANAARSSLEGQIYDAKGEAERIGVTGAALGELTKKRVDDAAAALEQQAAAIAIIDPAAQAVEALRAQAQAMRDLFKVTGNNSAAQAVYDYGKAVREQNAALQYELSLMGLSEQQRNVLLEQKRIELDLEKQIDAIKARTAADPAKQAELIGKANADAAIAKANAANKAFLDEWKTSVGKYDDIFRQGFADMLNNGKDGWKSFTRSLVTTFKTTVADQIYKMFAQPFVVNIVGNLLGLVGGGAAQAVAGAASGGSALGTIGNAASGLSALTGTFGMGLRAGLSGLFGEAGLAGTISAGTTAIGAGNIAGGLGTLAGPLALVGGGLLVLNSLLKSTKGETRTGGQFGVSFDGTVTNQRRDQVYTYQGQQFDRDFSNGQRNALIAGQAYRLEGDPVQNEQAIRDAVSGTASGINAFLKALGSKATLTGFSAGLETSSKGRGGVFAGGILSDGTTFGESGKGDNYAGTLYEKFSTNSPDFKTALENFTLDLKQATIQALQTVSDIPQAVQKLLKGVDAEGLTEDAANKLLETINAQIVGVNQFKDALKGMGLDTLAALSFDAAAGLAEVSGGFDKLLGNLQTYYTNFFTGEEQRANLQRSLAQQLSTLGLQLPDINASNARDQFRALVSAAEKDMSESGRKTYATLLALSGAFASITEAAQTTTQTLEQQRQAYYGALQDAVSARNKSLQSQLSAAQEVEGTLENLFGILRNNVRELYGEVDGTRGMLASQGNAFIDQALATAKASGYLPDADKLAEAIGAVRGGMDGRAYTTQFAADRDRLVLAGKLSGLEGIAEKQLTDAQKTVRALETQIDQNEQVLDYWKQQIDIANGTYQGILSVESAVQQLSGFLGGTGSTRPTAATGSLGGDVSGPAYRDRGTVARAEYGADVALSSFDKFKAWYQGLATNANVGALQSAGYQVPDWMRVGGMAGDSTDKELFGSYLYFKNNPQFAKDFEQVMTTGRSSLPTDGSTLVRSDLSKMPADIAAYFQSDRNSLLSYEAMGLDPVLAYKLYKDGPEQFGLNLSRENFTEWLRTHKWTDGGVVSANNTLDTAKGYAGYNLARYDNATGNIVNLDGSIYSPDGKYLGMAGRDLMTSVYGSAFLGTSGGNYGDATRSALYNSQVQGGNSEAAYYGAIKSNLDAAIAGGMSAQGIADAITQTGASMADVAAAYGITVAQLEENLRAGGATNIPKFAVGTNYVPRDMLAYIHEGEAVVPKAYNPAAGGGGAGGNAELVAEVRALREQNATMAARLEAIEKNTQLMPEMGRQFNQYSNGGTFSRQKAIA